MPTTALKTIRHTNASKTPSTLPGTYRRSLVLKAALSAGLPLLDFLVGQELLGIQRGHASRTCEVSWLVVRPARGITS